MEHFWQEIDGYFTFPEFYEWVAVEATKKRQWWGVEVGVYTGQSAAFLFVELARQKAEARLDLVDIEMSRHGTAANLAPLGPLAGQMYELDSVDASRIYADASLDFVFIDADHAYESVRRDIDAWLPKVRKGGIIAGHDYCLEFSGVIRAVTETFDRVEVWRGRKGMGDQRMIDTGNYFPCWSVRV